MAIGPIDTYAETRFFWIAGQYIRFDFYYGSRTGGNGIYRGTSA